jgi:hypothetical protein
MSSSFISWYDPTVECTPVWDGTGSTPYLLATKDDPRLVSMGSSLVACATVGPAKAIGPGGSRGSRGTGHVSQTAMRA